jgi:hypothetical protein
VSLVTTLDRQSSPFFKVRVEPKVSTQLLFDTGDDRLMSISDNYMSVFERAHAYQVVASGYGGNRLGHNGAEKDELKYRLQIGVMSVGDVTLRNVVTETAHNNSTNGNRIGARLLEYGVVTLDYVHGRFYFEASRDGEIDANETGWPISLKYDDGKAVVGVVWSNMKDSVTAGMQILAVDDRPCERIDVCEMLMKPLLQGKERAVIALKGGDGVVRKVEIAKR